MSITKAINKLATENRLTIYEPCNCGSQIRHNNGGNYHQIITIEIRDNGAFARFDDTCELTPPEPFREISYFELSQIVRDHADWL